MNKDRTLRLGFSIYITMISIFVIVLSQSNAESVTFSGQVSDPKTASIWRPNDPNSSLKIESEPAEVFLQGEGRRSCLAGDGSISCKAHGPQKIILKFQDSVSEFQLTEGEGALCYTGEHGQFCDVYRYGDANRE